MKKIIGLFSIVVLFVFSLVGCKQNDKVIRVCASSVPHAEVLENCVKQFVEKEGYTLEVKVLDWTLQNEAVASGDYDANYFQHVPYLETYDGKVALKAFCKVHYEPLGIYSGKKNTVEEAKSIAICNDESNAIRTFELLYAKKIITNTPVENGKLTFNGKSWTSENGVAITLLSESLLAAALSDYDLVCLPGNTAYTAKIKAAPLLKEDAEELVVNKANVLAGRLEDYQKDSAYQKKIDVLVNALLSEDVRQFFAEQYNNAMTCNEQTQIDLR